jgi:hypothetical protein
MEPDLVKLLHTYTNSDEYTLYFKIKNYGKDVIINVNLNKKDIPKYLYSALNELLCLTVNNVELYITPLKENIKKQKIEERYQKRSILDKLSNYFKKDVELNNISNDIAKHVPNYLELLLELYPNENWHYGRLSKNPNISWEYIQKHPDKERDLTNRDKQWNYTSMIKNKNITFKMIKNNLDLFLVYHISKNPNITWDDVLENPKINWNYGDLSSNSNITWKIICDNHHLDWDIQKFSKNINVTIKIVKDNLKLDWDFAALSKNPAITFEDIMNNRDLPWDFMYVALNPNLTYEMVNSTPELEWNNLMVSRNANVTWNIVKNNIKKYWDPISISENPNPCMQSLILNVEDMNAFKEVEKENNPYRKDTFSLTKRCFMYLSENRFYHDRNLIYVKIKNFNNTYIKHQSLKTLNQVLIDNVANIVTYYQ